MRKPIDATLALYSIAAILSASLTLKAQANSLDLLLVSQDSVPPIGTFYLLSTMGTNGFGPPWPFNPVEQLQPDVFWLGTNSFLNADAGSFIIDDSSIDYSSMQSGQMMTDGAPSPPGDGGSEDTNTMIPMLAYDYSTNAFYLEVEPQWLTNVLGGVTNNWIGVVLHSTVPDVAYDLLSKSSQRIQCGQLSSRSWEQKGRTGRLPGLPGTADRICFCGRGRGRTMMAQGCRTGGR